MDKNSVLCQLMGLRMNGVMNAVVMSDEEYLAIQKKSSEYSDRLEDMDLPEDVRQLFDQFISEQNALGARYGALAYLLGFSDCVELLSRPCFSGIHNGPG